MVPDAPFVTDSYHNVSLINETKAFEYVMKGYQMASKCLQETRIGLDTASKEGIVYLIKTLSDSIDLSTSLGFQWAILTPSLVRECTHYSVKCIMLVSGNDTVITLERITSIMNGE